MKSSNRTVTAQADCPAGRNSGSDYPEILHASPVAAEVRRRVPTVSVLYVSGYAERGTGPAAALVGPLLAKPFTSVSIAQKVREILDAAVATAR